MARTLERPPAGDAAGRPRPGVPRPPGTGFRPGPAGWGARGAAVLIPLLVGVWYVRVNAQVRSDALATAAVIAIGALSLNVLVGYTGQISLGHQAFIGIGAFTSAYIVSESHQPFLVGVLVALAVGAAQAVILGLIALRVRGLYFALVTLAWGKVAEQCLFRLKSFTRGGAGAQAPRPAGFTTDKAYLLVCLVGLALVLLVDWRLVATKAGRAMQALRESPQVAANYGVDVKGYTLYAFAVAGAYAGLAGALLASRRLTVQSGDFDFAGIALTYLIVTVVGGLRRRGGIVAFSLLYVLGGEYLPDLARAIGFHTIEVNAGYYIQALSAVLAILTLVFQPDGLGTVTAPIGRWLRGERFQLAHGGGAPGAGGGGHERP
ncbi:MAG TPA: branched-chain amino acid ABC transporter permease [Acidimicrobiales bacterium]|nr:branched-chain amino acid ABC transporter permease [Acidimicrobiales bacterium]